MLQRCKMLGRTISFTLEYIEIRKHFLNLITPRPPVCRQKLLPVYVLPYFTHCMEVASWHKGGGVQQPQNPGPKPIKCIFYRKRNEWQ